MAEKNPLIVDQLLAETAWMRRLAGTLVRPGKDADDLVQDAYLAGLSGSGATVFSVRAWVATVFRRTAGRTGRRERRRVEIEGRTAPSEIGADSTRSVEIAQIHERLAREVQNLAEPFRTAVVMRFYEDATNAEIAQRIGLPEATVRSRISRGIARLRESLDGAFDGGRPAWIAALTMIARPGDGMTISGSSVDRGGSIAVKKIMAAAAAVIVVAGTAALSLWRDADEGNLEAVKSIVADGAGEKPRRATPDRDRKTPMSAAKTDESAPEKDAAGRDVVVEISRDGGHPLPNVDVVVTRGDAIVATSRTDVTGQAPIRSAHPSDVVYIGAEGFCVESRPIGRRERISVTLLPTTSVKFVALGQNGDFAAGVTIVHSTPKGDPSGGGFRGAVARILAGGFSPMRSIKTASDGSFTIGGFTLGQVISFGADGDDGVVAVDDAGPFLVVDAKNSVHRAVIGKVPSIKGRVIDADRSRGIAHCPISIRYPGDARQPGESTCIVESDADGRFEATLGPTSCAFIEVTATVGLQSVRRTIENVRRGASDIGDLEFSGLIAERKVNVSVLDADRRPIAEASAKIVGGIGRPVRAGRDGALIFSTNMIAGKTIEFGAPQFVPKFIEVEEDGALPASIVLLRSNELTVVVTTDDGQPAFDRTVMIKSEQSPFRAGRKYLSPTHVDAVATGGKTVQESGGRWTLLAEAQNDDRVRYFDLDPEATLDVSVIDRFERPIVEEKSLRLGMTESRVIHLRLPKGQIRDVKGVVRGTDGVPCRGGRLSIGVKGSYRKITVEIGSDGGFFVSDVDFDRADVVVVAPNARKDTIEGVEFPSSGAPLEIVVQRQFPLVVRVIDQDGHPVAAKAKVASANTVITPSTGSIGRYEFVGVADAAPDVTVIVAGRTFKKSTAPVDGTLEFVIDGTAAVTIDANLATIGDEDARVVFQPLHGNDGETFFFEFATREIRGQPIVIGHVFPGKYRVGIVSATTDNYFGQWTERTAKKEIDVMKGVANLVRLD